jgi:deazaflavin-dependent oxidoreductase (nitroreductase family)
MADTTPNEPDPGRRRRPGDDADPAGAAPGRGGGRARPVRQYRPSRGRRVGDAIISVFVRAGLVPSTYLLTTKGRKTGRPLTHPATVVEHDGRRWLVAPYGPVSWVHNARAAGRVTLRRRGDRQTYAIREVPAPEAGPVLKRYVAIATATRPYFQADKDAPVEDFAAEAARHPVFELITVTQDHPDDQR